MINHLAVIMDGNRRWARKNKMNILLGHSKGGVDAATRAISFALEKGIAHLSLYTFSLENLKRSKEEKDCLFDLIISNHTKHLDNFTEKGVRVRFIGDRTQIPEDVLQACIKIEKATESFSTLHLNVLFCYGARQEIIAGIKKLYHKIKNGILSEDEICEKEFEQCLWLEDTPEPELLIRTGGTHRLSNFLLYQSAYTELYFLDCLWPEITHEHLEEALSWYLKTKRNFGV